MNDSHDDLNLSQPQSSVTDATPNHLRRVEIAVWLLAIVLGFFHVWANRHELINSDAMSYLDIAEAYLRRDWPVAINSYWSPLYSWIIALALLISRPSPYWKFTVLHVLNLLIFLFALSCFGFLIREIIRRRRKQHSEIVGVRLLPLPDWALLTLGYSLFLWTSLFLISIRLESPDMLVASFSYLASGIVLRISRRPLRWPLFFLLGIVLGFGYLAKSVMFPMALVFILAAFFAVGSWRQALSRVLVTVVLFLLIATPFVVAISRSKGRLTLGESGKLNYLWAINRVPYFHWQGEPGYGAPKHPTRKIFDTPPAFEFGEPVGGTYPVWLDPTHWYEGSVNRFDLGQHMRTIIEAVFRYYEIFHKWGIQYALLVGLLVLYFMGRKPRLLLGDLAREWSLIFPAIAGMGMYTVVNVQGRYVAPFIVLLWLALFSAVRLPRTADAEKLVRSVAIILVVSIISATLASSSRETVLTLRQLPGREDAAAHEQWQIAEGLREMGVASGDTVAFVGDSFRAFWAHLLRVRVVAEVRRDAISSFWEMNGPLRDQLIKAFSDTGAKAVVFENPPPGAALDGWQKIRHTNYYVYKFK